MKKQTNYLGINSSCNNYDKGEESLIEFKVFEKGSSLKASFVSNMVIIVIKGRLKYAYGMSPWISIAKGEVLLVPQGFEVELIIKEETELLRIAIGASDRLCGNHLVSSLRTDTMVDTAVIRPQHLRMEERMEAFAQSQKSYFSTGLRCYYFHEIKVQEFFYILRMYYSREDLGRFFAPVINYDKDFSSQVINASLTAKSVLELATAVDYSLSGFNKKFKRVFTQPPYGWLQDIRAKRLFKSIIRNNTPFKELSEIEGFSSLSEFTRFAKKHYGSTPSELRRQPKEQISQRWDRIEK